jgi:CHAT domain-containing protein
VAADSLRVASLARQSGRYQEALSASQRAVEASERANRPQLLARALYQLGITHVSLNAHRKATQVLERAALIARQANLPPVEALSYAWLGKAFRALQDIEASIRYTERSVQLFENFLMLRSLDRGRTTPQGRAGFAHLESQYGRTLIELGSLHATQRRWPDARETFQRALALGERLQNAQLVAMARNGLGSVAAASGQMDQAVREWEAALAKASQPELVAATNARLGRAYSRLGKFPEAERALRSAVTNFEEIRSLLQSEELRESFFEDKESVYEGLIFALLPQRKAGEAFDMAERARARAFLDLLGNRVALSRDEALLAEERSLQERIAALKATAADAPAAPQELEQARAAYQAFLQRVRQTNREQASLLAVEPLKLAQVQSLLPDGALLLEYFVSNRGTVLVWTVSRSHVSLARIAIDRQALGERIQHLRDSIASRSRQAEVAQQALALGELLVRPALVGRTPTELIIVPHDVLHYIPFHALMLSPDRYLIQEAPISYLSSASLMQFTRQKAGAHTAATLALGNPDLRDPQMNLRYAEREVQAVAELVPDTLALIRENATKAKSREFAPQRGILHFATHAEFDEEDPLGSALLLAPTLADDGRLDVQEIFGLELHASLVVLSACETSLGKRNPGDEIISLTRAFIYAGTPSVITTLWKVNDRASYELVQTFYRQLQTGQSKAEALRQAQITTLQKYPHPYYWAAYQLTGEPQ